MAWPREREVSGNVSCLDSVGRSCSVPTHVAGPMVVESGIDGSGMLPVLLRLALRSHQVAIFELRFLAVAEVSSGTGGVLRAARARCYRNVVFDVVADVAARRRGRLSTRGAAAVAVGDGPDYGFECAADLRAWHSAVQDSGFASGIEYDANALVLRHGGGADHSFRS